MSAAWSRGALVACVGVLSLAGSASAGVREECLSSSSSAQDLRVEKKLIAARAQLLSCARDACPLVVKRDCVQWLAEVDASMPTLVITARDSAGADVVAARVLLDGAPYLERLEGKALSIDPGVHKIRVESVGAAPIEQEIVIVEGEKNRILALTLAPIQQARPEPPVRPEPTPPPPPPAIVAAEPPTTASSSSVAIDTHRQVPPPAPDRTKTWRLVAIGTVGVGVVAVGVGTWFGLAASSRWDRAQDACGDGCIPGSPAYALRSDADQAATFSTIGFIAGGVAIASGVAFYLRFRDRDPGPVMIAISRSAAQGFVGCAGSF